MVIDKKQKHGGGNENEEEDQNPIFPEDLVVEEILTRLPAKSLLRFKSVDKTWYSSIREPAFIRLHHNRSKTRPDGGCLVIYMMMPKDEHIVHNLCTAGYQGGPASRLLSSRRYTFSTSIHGLILVSPKNSFKVFRPVFIYNPTTKELVSLPPIASYIDDPNCDVICANYSLGYDPLTGQYKVLAMCTLFQTNDSKVEKVSNCLFVFVLGTRSWTWRQVDIDFPNPSRIVINTACSVNGALHWLVRLDGKFNGGESVYEFILAFDVGKEEFRKIPLSGKLAYLHMLSEVGDRLALSGYELGDNGATEVWVLEGYDDEGEWLKVKVATPLQWTQGDRLCEIRSIHSGEKFLVTPHRKEMAKDLRVHYYDKGRKECSMVEVTGLPVDPDFLDDVVAAQVSNNVETLFSPRAGLESNNGVEFNSVESDCSEFGLCLH